MCKKGSKQAQNTLEAHRPSAIKGSGDVGEDEGFPKTVFQVFLFFSFLLFFPFFFFVDPSSLGFVCDDRFPSVRNIQYTYTYTRSDTVQREGKRTRTRGESIMRDVALFFQRCRYQPHTLLYSTPPRKKKGAVPALARSLPNTKSRSHGRCSLFNKDDGVR